LIAASSSLRISYEGTRSEDAAAAKEVPHCLFLL